jgi:hypothetical protein
MLSWRVGRNDSREESSMNIEAAAKAIKQLKSLGAKRDKARAAVLENFEMRWNHKRIAVLESLDAATLEAVEAHMMAEAERLAGAAE